MYTVYLRKSSSISCFSWPKDIFLKKWPHFGCALAVINEKMKKYSTKTTLVAFCWTLPARSRQPGARLRRYDDTSACQNIEIYWEVKDTRKLIIVYLSRSYLYHCPGVQIRWSNSWCRLHTSAALQLQLQGESKKSGISKNFKLL